MSGYGWWVVAYLVTGAAGLPILFAAFDEPTDAQSLRDDIAFGCVLGVPILLAFSAFVAWRWLRTPSRRPTAGGSE